MTGRDAAIQAPCLLWLWPGANASASADVLASGERIVSLFFDPMQVAVQVPPFPDGPTVIARFYRQVARVCTQVAAELDPAGALHPHQAGADRHALRDRP